MCISARQVDERFCTLFFNPFFRFYHQFFKRMLIYFAKKRLPNSSESGYIFLVKTCFLQMSILAHNSFICYISKAFYCTPNVCRVFMQLTLIVYTINRYNFFCILSHENCHFVTCHFHIDFNVRKKRKVRNILIINILNINIYFFCYQFFGKVTSDK